MTYRISQSCINLQRVLDLSSFTLLVGLYAFPFSRAHVGAKTPDQGHIISTILSYPGPCWRPGKTPIHLWNSGRVLGLGGGPSVAHVVPSLFVNYNSAYGRFSSCANRSILSLGESCAAILYWLISSQLAG
jgi:hypothetical protein